MQRVWLINWKNITNDSDLTTPILASMTQGIIEGFGIVNGYLQQWKAVIKCRRTNWPELMAIFESDELLSIPSAGNKSIYIQIDQTKIDNGSNNNSDWSWIWSIVIADSFPITEYNWIELYSVVDWTPIDERKGPKSLLETRKLYENEWLSYFNWQPAPVVVPVELNSIIQYTVDNSELNSWAIVIKVDNKNISIVNNSIKNWLIKPTNSLSYIAKNWLILNETWRQWWFSGIHVFSTDWSILFDSYSYQSLNSKILTTPWDVTASTDWESLDMTALWLFDLIWYQFSVDWTILIICGVADGWVVLVKYNLSTAWDLSSATLEVVVDMNRIVDVFTMSSDWVYLYITAWWDATVTRYTLSTPWDLTTIGNPEDQITPVNNIINSYRIYFVDSQTWYIVNYSEIIKFKLSTAWDLTTMELELYWKHGFEMDTPRIAGINNNNIYFSRNDMGMDYLVITMNMTESNVWKSYLMFQ